MPKKPSISTAKLKLKSKLLNGAPSQQKVFLAIIELSKETLSFPLPSEIEKKTDLNLAHVYSVLEALVEKRFLLKISRYHYRLSPAE